MHVRSTISGVCTMPVPQDHPTALQWHRGLKDMRSGQGDKVVYQRLCAAMRSQECEWMVHGASEPTPKTESAHRHDVMNDGKCHECA